MRLYTKHLEPTMHRGFGDARILHHGTAAPIHFLGRLAVEGGIAHFGHPLGIMGAGITGALFLPQAFDWGLCSKVPRLRNLFSTSFFPTRTAKTEV